MQPDLLAQLSITSDILPNTRHTSATYEGKSELPAPTIHSNYNRLLPDYASLRANVAPTQTPQLMTSTSATVTSTSTLVIPTATRAVTANSLPTTSPSLAFTPSITPPHPVSRDASSFSSTSTSSSHHDDFPHPHPLSRMSSTISHSPSVAESLTSPFTKERSTLTAAATATLPHLQAIAEWNESQVS